MKKTVFVVVIVIMAGVFLSCASKPPANSLGEVEARFESPDVLRGSTPLEAQAMNVAGQGMVSGNAQNAQAGAAIAGVTLLGQGLGNAPIKKRLNEAAREALLVNAKFQYGEDIDLERIRFTLISQNHQTGLYLYTATAFVIPAKKGATDNKIESDIESDDLTN